MYLNEAKTKQEKDDLAMFIEEVLNQRIQGTKNEVGVYITPAFPKLLYVLEEDNITEDSEYWWLTELAAKCTAKRMVPDYISEKVMIELKGYCFPCMGAVKGDEIVSIKVNDVEFNDVPIKEAFNIIRASTHIHGGGFHVVSELKKTFYHKCGVYKITHIPSGKYYIGSSKDIYRRLIEHKTKCTHMGTLGELYFINDFNPDNFKYELLKECNIDDLWNIEAEYIDLNDPNCVNHKDSRFNGNFKSENVKLGANGKKYSDYINRAYTWVKDVSNFEIFVKSKEEWKKVLKITYNDRRKCPLKLYEISIDRNGEIQKIHVTEDHPFHTDRGRVETKDLLLSDRLFSPNLAENYEIVSIAEDTEDYDTYDFEVDNDIFNLSGILSHNCRSFLTPDEWSNKLGNISNSKTFEEHKGQISYSRFNSGVVTLNLVDLGLSADKDLDKFWKLFEERTELCHKALKCRHERLRGTKSDISPIHWQYGGLARLKPGETIDKLLFNNYSTLSLGYAGLWECVLALIGKKLTTDEGKALGLQIMQKLNDKCEQWKKAENIGYSLYGSPIESTTAKFARCLKKRFGEIEGITDRDYITNSYHVHVTEPIDAFDKLAFEAEFQKLSPGGAISYIECPNLEKNTDAVLEVIKFIYDTIMYAELNIKSDYCMNCGFDGEILYKEDENGKKDWTCPNCGCRDHKKLNVARRTCGYIGSQFWSPGRSEEIAQRVTHLDNFICDSD